MKKKIENWKTTTVLAENVQGAKKVSFIVESCS